MRYFLQGGWHSCHPTNSVRAVKKYTRRRWKKRTRTEHTLSRAEPARTHRNDPIPTQAVYPYWPVADRRQTFQPSIHRAIKHTWTHLQNDSVHLKYTCRTPVQWQRRLHLSVRVVTTALETLQCRGTPDPRVQMRYIFQRETGAFTFWGNTAKILWASCVDQIKLLIPFKCNNWRSEAKALNISYWLKCWNFFTYPITILGWKLTNYRELSRRFPQLRGHSPHKLFSAAGKTRNLNLRHWRDVSIPAVKMYT